MVILSAIHETTAAAVLTVVAADELASSSASGFSRAGAAAGTAGSTLSGEPTGELGWEILPSSVSVSRELFSAFSTSSLSAEDLSADKVCPIASAKFCSKCVVSRSRVALSGPVARSSSWAGSPPSLPPDLTIARSRSPHQFVNGNLIDEACQQSKKQASRGPRGRAARLTQNRGAVREVDRRHKKTVNLFCFTQILGAKFAMLRQTFIPHWHNEIAHSVISQVFNAHNPLICARTFTATCVALRTLRHSQHVPLPRLPRCRERGEFSRIPSATQSIHPSAGDAHLCTLVHRLSSRRPRRTPS